MAGQLGTANCCTDRPFGKYENGAGWEVPRTGPAQGGADLDGDTRSPDASTTLKQASRPHEADEIEVSAGIVERKHFAGPLERWALLFLLILRQTRHRSVRWRRGEWHPVASLAADCGYSVRTIQRALKDLSDPTPPGPYLTVERGPRGIRIQFVKRVWFRGRQAMLTALLPAQPWGDNLVTPTPPGGVTETVGGGDRSVTPRSKSVTPWASEHAPDADSVIRLSRTSSEEQASGKPVASLNPETHDDDRPGAPPPADFWKPPRRPRGGS